jgi:hypothetical protein
MLEVDAMAKMHAVVKVAESIASNNYMNRN